MRDRTYFYNSESSDLIFASLYDQKTFYMLNHSVKEVTWIEQLRGCTAICLGSLSNSGFFTEAYHTNLVSKWTITMWLINFGYSISYNTSISIKNGGRHFVCGCCNYQWPMHTWCWGGTVCLMGCICRTHIIVLTRRSGMRSSIQTKNGLGGINPLNFSVEIRGRVLLTSHKYHIQRNPESQS